MFKVVATLGDDKEWVKLPGRAKDWPKGYDYETSGWDVPVGLGKQVAAFFKELNRKRPSKNFFAIFNRLQQAEMAEKLIGTTGQQMIGR